MEKLPLEPHSRLRKRLLTRLMGVYTSIEALLTQKSSLVGIFSLTP